jgi:phage-related protein
MAIPKIIAAIVDTFRNMDWAKIGKDILKGIINGFLDIGNLIWNAVKKVGNSMLGAIQKFFGIASPSKLMRDKVGRYLTQGIGVGFEDELDSVYNDMQRALDFETDKMSANVQASGTYQMAMAGTPTFNLLDNTSHSTQLVVNGKVLAEVVNTENKNREVATS